MDNFSKHVRFLMACHFSGFPVVRPSLFNLLSPKTLELNLFVLNKQMNGLCWKSKQSCALLDKEFVKSLLSFSSWMLLRLFFSSLNVSKGKLEGFVVHPTSVTSLTHIFYQILGIGRDRNFQKGCSVANWWFPNLPFNFGETSYLQQNRKCWQHWHSPSFQ